MLFSRGPLCDSAASLPSVIQCAPPDPGIAAGTPCNPVPLIQGNRVSSSLGDEIADVIASAYLSAASGAVEASFWKRGSFRSGSNMGSSRRSAGVSGTFSPSALAPGIESTFCKAAMARSGSPMRAATLARMSI